MNKKRKNTKPFRDVYFIYIVNTFRKKLNFYEQNYSLAAFLIVFRKMRTESNFIT